MLKEVYESKDEALPVAVFGIIQLSNFLSMFGNKRISKKSSSTSRKISTQVLME